MNATVGVLVTLGLLVLNAFFVAAEFALVAARRSGIEPLAEAGSRRAAVTLRAMERISVMMAGAQLGITVCSLALGAVSEPALAHLLEPVLDAAGVRSGAQHVIAFVVALALVTVLHVVLGEMVPKNITLAGPERAAVWLGPPLVVIVTALKPVIVALNAGADLGLRVVRVRPRDEVSSTVTRAEIGGVVAHSRQEGLLEADAHDRLAGAIAFDTATAADLALPLDRVHTLPATAGVAEVEALAARTGVTRFPVRDGARLLGYVHLKDVLGVDESTRFRAEPLPHSLVRALPAVPAGASLDDAIEVMRDHRAHMAQVTAGAEPGPGSTTVGVITLDDILAGLVRV